MAEQTKGAKEVTWGKDFGAVDRISVSRRSWQYCGYGYVWRFCCEFVLETPLRL